MNARINVKRQGLTLARAGQALARTAYQGSRDALARDLAASRAEVERLRFLVARDAEPRTSLDAAGAALRALETRQTELAVAYSAAAADAQARADALALELQQLAERRTRAETAQVVRSPIAGKVAEVRVKDATQAGVLVEVVIITEVPHEQAENAGRPVEAVSTRPDQ